jgi:multicomponent Na+:H+ antiporter subunit D
MINLTLIWIVLPFFIGLVSYLLPKLAPYLSFGGALASIGYVGLLLTERSPWHLSLMDHFGVTLLADSLSGYFILTNGLVTAVVLFYGWSNKNDSFFYAQSLILHGSINTTFICADLMSLYVSLEVLCMAVFLLIAYPRSDRSLWVALRYGMVGNTALLFYLIGVVLVYQKHHSFGFEGLADSPPEAIALILLGLLTKGGIFISGLWAPLTNAESETPVSALLCGIVEKAPVFSLMRIALTLDELAPLITMFGVGTALLGVLFSLFEQDTKRLLAFSTLSQLGWLLVAPAVGGVYALAHGLAKTGLFLLAGALPSRDLKELQQTQMNLSLWIPLAIASLSISGAPLLLGFVGKTLTDDVLLPGTKDLMTLAAVGTATVYAKLIFFTAGMDG